MTTRKGLSFATMMDAGATTLWETWSGDASHDHPMFGAAVKLLFTEILGIRQPDTGVGYQEYTISPADIPQLDWAEGYLTTCCGVIRVKWQRDSQGKLCILDR